MYMKTAKGFVLVLLLLSAGIFSGCFALPVEEESYTPSFFQLTPPPPWRTVEVRRGTVELFTSLVAAHEPAQQEILRFDVGGVAITGLYVNLGDEVEEGDIIASLARTGVSTELERMLRDESRLMLRIEHEEERHAHTLWMAEVSGVPVDDSPHLNRLADMREDLYMLRLEKDYVQRQYESRLIRAGMSGVVTFVMPFAQRTNSVLQQHVATISDHSVSFFVVRSREAAYLNVGDRFEMDVGGTLLWVEVIDPVEWGIERPEVEWVEAIFMVDGGGVFAPGARGAIRVVFEAVHDVLYLPIRAVHTVGERRFVYVLEDGIRRIRDVEIGRVGTLYIEITKGLELGEVIVR
jgi:hypothetical protein